MFTTMTTMFTTTTVQNTVLALDSGSVGGQGFHAVKLDAGPSASNITPIAGRNAIIRVSGNVSTPVELINFNIE
jgi:hypothetical protein